MKFPEPANDYSGLEQLFDYVDTTGLERFLSVMKEQAEYLEENGTPEQLANVQMDTLIVVKNARPVSQFIH